VSSLLFHPEARNEYTDAFLWYEMQQKGLGKKFSSVIEKTIEQIENNPELFKVAKGVYREAVVSTFPFSIIYRFNKKKKTIFIIAVYHASRNPKKKFRK
jgi:mRNA-degrading endonuclease RelE of RelBE toxin-antitoxin system